MYKCIRVNLINFSLSNGCFNGFFFLFFYLTVHINVYVVLILFLSC